MAANQVRSFYEEVRSKYVYHMRGGEGIDGDGTTLIEKIFRVKDDPKLTKTRIGLGMDCSHLVHRYWLKTGVNVPYLPTRVVLPAKGRLGKQGAEYLDLVEPASVRVGDVVHWRGHAGIVSKWDSESQSGRAVQIGVKSQVAEIDFGLEKSVGFGPVLGFVRAKPKYSSPAQRGAAAIALGLLERAEGEAVTDYRTGSVDPPDSEVVVSRGAFDKLPEAVQIRRTGALGFFDRLLQGFADFVDEALTASTRYQGTDWLEKYKGDKRPQPESTYTGDSPASKPRRSESSIPHSFHRVPDFLSEATKRHQAAIEAMHKRDREARELRDRAEDHQRRMAEWHKRMRDEEEARRKREQQRQAEEATARKRREDEDRRQRELREHQQRQAELQRRQRDYLMKVDRDRHEERQRRESQRQSQERQDWLARERQSAERRLREKERDAERTRLREMLEQQRREQQRQTVLP